MSLNDTANEFIASKYSGTIQAGWRNHSASKHDDRINFVTMTTVRIRWKLDEEHLKSNTTRRKVPANQTNRIR